MFTGIVEALGEVVSLDRGKDSARLRLRAPGVTAGTAPGDSLAVDGVCLTVVDTDDTGEVTADVMRETLDRSSLGSLSAGSWVNLERPVPVDGRLGGHVVQGHVDGVGRIGDRTPGDRWELVQVELPEGLARYVVEKGSVTIDGVSLTVVSVDDTHLTVSLVPTTLERTTLGRKSKGDAVNVEVDVLAKYVERLLQWRNP